MAWLIDSDLWIAVERQALDPADLHAFTRQEAIFVSPVKLAEIQVGAELVTDRARKIRALDVLRRMGRKPVVPITRETASVFGRLAARLIQAGRGHTFRLNDLWLASQAVQRGFRLLTRNVADYRDIPDLQLVEFSPP